MTELIGTRVMLRPLRAEDWEAWREVRLRCRHWLERWEPVPEPGSADPALDYEAFRARCAAWERQRHFDAAYGFGLFLTDGRFAGEVSLGSVQRGPFQMGYVGYWIDEAFGGNAYVPEGVVLIIRYAFETLRLHRLEAAIVPIPSDPGNLRGPHSLRHHPRGVERTRAGARPALPYASRRRSVKSSSDVWSAARR